MLRSIIVAVSDNQVIGKDNDLIWHLPKDLAFFKRTTSQHHMLLGRRTFEAIGGPLKNRFHLVISRNFEYEHPEVAVFNDIEKAIEFASNKGESELFIAGGGKIYEYCLENDLVDQIYLTRVHATFEGDTFFPELSEDQWELVSSEKEKSDERNAWDMSFQLFRRR